MLFVNLTKRKDGISGYPVARLAHGLTGVRRALVTRMKGNAPSGVNSRNPKPINLVTTDEARASGWAAEACDADGHLMTTHAPFSGDAEFMRYANECEAEGWDLTVFFRKKP